jgi:signal transduction histidine kinase
MLHKKVNITYWLSGIAIVVVLMVAIFLSYYLAFKGYSISHRNVIPIRKGVLDLRGTVMHNRLMTVEGDVEFYWKKLLSPDDLKSSIVQPDTYIEIPGIWNGHIINDETLTGFGYGTYHFKILVSDMDHYAFAINEFDCAYKIWINNEVATGGRVGISKKEMKPSWKRKTIHTHPDENGVIDVVIQISNFHHRKGGAEDAMVFGLMPEVIYYRYAHLATSSFLLGVLLVMCIYHFLLYVYRRKDWSNILFGAICFVMAIRLITTGEKLIVELFPAISWLTSLKLEYLSYKIVVPLMIGFVSLNYPGEVSKYVVKASVYLAALFCAVVLFTPPIVFTHTPVYYQIIIALLSLYLFYALVLALIRKRQQSVIFLLGYLFFMAVIFNDILYYNKVIDTGFFMPLGVFVLIFSQSAVLSLKSSQAFKTAEGYQDMLQNINAELESKVAERTTEIELQKRELEVQANILKEANNQLSELGLFKKNMTSMIVHDLKNPLNIVLNYGKDERILMAAKQMLNLVQNILDVERQEESHLELELVEVSLVEIISRALQQTGYLLYEKNIILIDYSAKNIILLVDKQLMERVMVNLLSNAMKFSPSNGKVTIASSIFDANILISVTDEGPGIPQEMHHKVFARFGQVAKRGIGKSESTGLGLAFCKMVVEEHEGNIGFESSLGAGSTFWVTLKIHRIEEVVQPEVPLEKIHIEGVDVSEKARRIITRYADELQSLKVYEISRIKTVMSQMEEESGGELKEWLGILNQHVWYGNQEEYDNMLKS